MRWSHPPLMLTGRRPSNMYTLHMLARSSSRLLTLLALWSSSVCLTPAVAARSQRKTLQKKIFVLIVERQISKDRGYRLLVQSLKYLGRKTNVRLIVRDMQGDLASNLKNSLRRVSPATKKIIVLTRASYPRKFNNFAKKEEYIAGLRAQSTFLSNNYPKDQILFLEYQRRYLHRIARFTSIFKNFAHIKQEVGMQVANLFGKDVRVHIVSPMRLDAPSTTIKLRIEKKNLSFRCFHDSLAFKQDRLPPYFSLKKGTITAKAASIRQKIPFGTNICIFKNKKGLISLLMVRYLKPKIKSDRHFFTLRFPRSPQVISRQFLITSTLTLDNVHLRIVVKKHEGALPKIFSDQRRWVRRKNHYLLLNHNGRALKSRLEAGVPKRFAFAYFGRADSRFEGVIDIMRNKQVLFSIPLKIRRALRVADVTAFVSRNYLTIILMVVAAAGIFWGLRSFQKRAHVSSGQISTATNDFSLLMKAPQRVRIGAKTNPFNAALKDLGVALRLVYKQDMLTVKKGQKVLAEMRALDAHDQVIPVNVHWVLTLSLQHFVDSKDEPVIVVRLARA